MVASKVADILLNQGFWLVFGVLNQTCFYPPNMEPDCGPPLFPLKGSFCRVPCEWEEGYDMGELGGVPDFASDVWSI